MNIVAKRLGTILLVVLMLLCAQEAEAQFLKKLSQGLEKVNKSLEKVEKGMDEIEDGIRDVTSNPLSQQLFRKRNKGENNTEQSEATDNTATSATAEDMASTPALPDDSHMVELKPRHRTPYITHNTKYLMMDDFYSNSVSYVHDGVFSIAKNGYFEFWDVEGDKIFNAEWQFCNEHRAFGYNYPHFGCGVVAARSRLANSQGQKPICLLYKDGAVKELDPSWSMVTTFKDGLALVTQGSYNKSYFYINVRGEKQYPNLKVYGDYDYAMRPLCEGLRAYSSQRNLWGYIDANGKVIIEPKYGAVGDFSEGYAWVIETDGNILSSEGRLLLINSKGEVVFNPNQINYFTSFGDGSSQHIASQVKDGIFYLMAGDKCKYYSVDGTLLGIYNYGTPFHNGYAMVEGKGELYDGETILINTSFQPVKRLPILDSSDLDQQPRFLSHGMASVELEDGCDAVIDYKGNILLKEHDGDVGYISGFQQVTESEMLLAKSINMNGEYYSAILRTNGEILWIIGGELIEEIRDGNWPRPPIDTMRRDTLRIRDPRPPYPPREDPRGPKTREKAKYSVTVIASPAEGGSAYVTPSKEFEYGDQATLIAQPAENWAVSDIVCRSYSNTSVTNMQAFTITSDMTIKVSFLKEEEELPPAVTGCFQGSHNNFDDEDVKLGYIDIYAEISKTPTISTPYGSNTYGFIVAMINPRQRIITDDLSAYIFSAPMKITGYQYDEENDRRWLIAEGGSVTVGNLKISPGGSSDPFTQLFLQMILSVNGQSTPQTIPRHYRIEMLDYDEQSGEFTCGMMETYNTKYGWLSADDKRNTKETKGFMMTMKDNGLPGNFFYGAEMKLSTKRNDVSWYPPLEWYDGQQSVLDQVISEMRSAYGSFQSDYDELFNK